MWQAHLFEGRTEGSHRVGDELGVVDVDEAIVGHRAGLTQSYALDIG